MKCPMCSSKVASVDDKCGACGRSLETYNLPLLEKQMKKRILTFSIIGLAVVLVATGAIVTTSVIHNRNVENERVAAQKLALENAKIAQERMEKERQDYSWVPKGYYKFSQDYNLAYKTIGYEAANCYDTCWGVKIKANEFCSTLIINVNIVRGGTILDHASDSAYDVSPANDVIMKFQSSFDTPWNAEVTSITCT